MRKMRKGKGKTDRGMKCVRAFSMAIVAAMMLSVCVGIVPVENGSLIMNAGATQNVTGNEDYRNLSVSLPGNETEAKNFILLKVRETKKEDVPNRRLAEVLKMRSYLKTPKVDDSGLTPPPAIVTSSIEEPASNLTINILNETTASGEWCIRYSGEYAEYLPFAHELFKENIKDVEKGMEDLFLQDVENISLTEGDENLLVTFDLKGNYTNSFVTGKFRYSYELSQYAPAGVGVLMIVIPQNKTGVSVNPGPNEIEGNKLTYYDYNWAYPIEIYYGEKLW